MPRVASVTDVIDVKDFDTVWNFLETKFGFSSQWRIDWQLYIDEQARQNPDTHPVLDFLAFGCRNIEPLLNAVLCRNPYYATFSRMVFWLVRDRLVNVGWIRFAEDDPF
jgi:hypothetical protein